MFSLGSHPYLLAVTRSLQGTSAGIVFTVGLSLLVAGIDHYVVGGCMGFVFSGMTAGLTFAPRAQAPHESCPLPPAKQNRSR